jgi:CRP-like cAMP-binding protein
MLDVWKVLEKPNRRIDQVYFPEAGFASVVAVQANETKIEVGLIGREGMTGAAVVLGNHRTPHSTYIQAAGEGQRISAVELRKAMEASPSLQRLFLKFVQAFMLQTAHTAIASIFRFENWRSVGMHTGNGADLANDLFQPLLKFRHTVSSPGALVVEHRLG